MDLLYRYMYCTTQSGHQPGEFINEHRKFSTPLRSSHITAVYMLSCTSKLSVPPYSLEPTCLTIALQLYPCVVPSIMGSSKFRPSENSVSRMGFVHEHHCAGEPESRVYFRMHMETFSKHIKYSGLDLRSISLGLNFNSLLS